MPVSVGLSFTRKCVIRVELGLEGEIRLEHSFDTAMLGKQGFEVSVARGVATTPNFEKQPLRCLTSSWAAVADVFGETAFISGGERIEVWRDENGKLVGRSFPVDGPDEEGLLMWKDRQIPISHAIAFAAAMCDPDRVPNEAQRLPGSRGAFWTRLREPLGNVAVAAALLLAGVGVWCHREMGREEAELGAARRATLESWSWLLPSETPKESGLPKALLRLLGGGGTAEDPSALAFWSEIGRRMPDVDALGLEIDALDLTPEGGRLSARVPAAKDDPLKNAAALEGHLNESDTLRARGDYEVRDGHVQVRLRLEFKP